MQSAYKEKYIPMILTAAVFLTAAFGAMQASAAETARYRKARERMVERQIADRGISDATVLEAMRNTPRHLFVPEGMRDKAYADHPLPIGEGQTISQPYIVALMTEILAGVLKEGGTVLEIGTGSGYQAAVLSHLAKTVYTVEIREKLHKRAAAALKEHGYDNVVAKHGDGYFGMPDQAPFDGIMITAAVDHIPPPLLAQLKEGGKLVLPLGNPFSYQNLVSVTKKGEDYTVEQILGVLFVPMTGRAMEK